mgnify:CR=1 FL=1
MIPRPPQRKCHFPTPQSKYTWRFRGTITALVTLIFTTASQAETAEQLFKRSLQENLDQPVDPQKLIAFGLVVVAIILGTVVINRWRAVSGRPRSTTALNSPTKLLREITRSVNLRPAEVKQLRILCEQQSVSNPLVMLLCPSVLSKAIRENQKRIDRTVLGGLAKKIARRV